MNQARALRRLLVSTLFLVAACSAHDEPARTFAITVAKGPSPILPIGGGNALTLPAQRHLVRIGSTLLLSIQQDGADGHFLRLFRSDDDGASFRPVGAIEDAGVDRDTTDMIVVGQDLALVYSYEGPELVGSTEHDVWFQWWRHNASGGWTPQAPVLLFDSTSADNGYYRAELTRDSRGRLWVQAFYLESDGSASAHVTVSTDGGASWSEQPILATLPFRGGGRLLASGSKILFVYDGHDDGTNPAHYRVRDDSQPLSQWGPEQLAFAEGIYHGAACSAVADGAGGIHLVYKDKNQVLWYRHFDGSSFGAPALIEDVGDWELQPATTLVDGDLVVYYNRVLDSGYDDVVRVRTLHAGAWSKPTVLDSSVSFKGYPTAVETLPATVTQVPCIFGVTPDANSSGEAVLYAIAWTSSTPPPDMGAPPDLSTPRDLSTPPDLSTVPDASAGGLLFRDDFQREIAPDNGLGNGWVLSTGLWYVDDAAISDSDGGDRALAPTSCSDCTVAVTLTSFGVADAGVVARVQPNGDRYELSLTGAGRLVIRRVRAGTATVLASAASGVADLTVPVSLSLSVSGSTTVTLRASVSGAVVVSATDAGASAIAGAGAPGLFTSSAGVPFNAFSVAH